jgi:bacteriocin biosynthesis cyclodehydratase domain-containing protein
MTSRVSPAGTGRGRLTLLPGLSRLWRDETAVQLGTDPSRAIVIELPDAGAARVLDLLDGSRTERAVLRDAGALGVPRQVTSAMISALRSANVLIGTESLVPSSMPETVRRRLLTEAAAIAMAGRAVEIPGIEAYGDDPAPADPTATQTGSTPSPTPADQARSIGRGTPAGTGAPAEQGTPIERTQRAEHAMAERPITPGRSGRRVPPAEAIRRRAAASVQVTGGSRLVVPIASTLARAGVGHVDPAVSGRVGIHDDAIGGLTPADTDRPRGTAASEAVLRAAPFTDTRALRVGGASFVVQVGQGVPAELAAFAYARKSLAHLLIEERDDTVLIGPLVPPGGSPCLRCLDLHRRDRDPAWPTLVAQLATSIDSAPTISTATTLIAVGVAVAQVLAYLDGDDAPTIGASIEVGPPSTLRRRSWGPHPRCDCAYRSRHRRRARAG